MFDLSGFQSLFQDCRHGMRDVGCGEEFCEELFIRMGTAVSAGWKPSNLGALFSFVPFKTIVILLILMFADILEFIAHSLPSRPFSL